MPAEPEIAQVAENHDESADKSKDVFHVARSCEDSYQDKTKPQNYQHDNAQILMASAAEKYGDRTYGNNRKKHHLVKNLFKLKRNRRTHDREQYERHRYRKAVDSTDARKE